MATPINKETDVQKPMNSIHKKQKIFGLTANKFGRIVEISLFTYEHMVNNDDTLVDENKLNSNFVKLNEKEIKVIQEYKKSTEKDKLKKEYFSLLVDKVSQIRNFMDLVLDGTINDYKTTLLPEDVFESLKEIKTTNTESVNVDELKESIRQELSAELSEKEVGLKDTESELAKREKELAKREKELLKKEKALEKANEKTEETVEEKTEEKTEEENIFN